ncbi:hypothetical protein U9M48_018920, partial [Paspalum notatum var. saurae]
MNPAVIGHGSSSSAAASPHGSIYPSGSTTVPCGLVAASAPPSSALQMRFSAMRRVSSSNRPSTRCKAAAWLRWKDDAHAPPLPIYKCVETSSGTPEEFVLLPVGIPVLHAGRETKIISQPFSSIME